MTMIDLTPVVTYRVRHTPMRRAGGGEVGSHFLTGDCTANWCTATAWRQSRYTGVVLLCDHGRIQPTRTGDTPTVEGLPYWAPWCR